MNRTLYIIIIILICVVSLVSFVIDGTHHDDTESEQKKFIYIINKTNIDKIKTYDNKKNLNYKNNKTQLNRVQCYSALS